MNYIITGGEFNNKGAEAMSFAAISQIRIHDPNAVIYFVSNLSDEMKRVLQLEQLSFTDDILECISSPSIFNYLKYSVKNVIKIFLRKRRCSLKRVRNIIRESHYMIDISGFALSSKFNIQRTKSFLNRIDAAVSSGCKVVLMPQSFGPFDYTDASVMKHLVEALSKCNLIYAREETGYSLLVELGLNNVVKANDMVLTVKNIDTFVGESFKLEPLLLQEKNVAIVPNSKTLSSEASDNSALMSLYHKIIQLLSKRGYHIIIIPHSGEDISLVKMITESSLEYDITCLEYVPHSYEYQKIAGQMDFIIASRYHSVVHAYKESTPAIILGWADKYCALARLFNQEKYVFDVSRSIDSDRIIDAVNLMIDNSIVESCLISHKLEPIQQDDLFAFITRNDVVG